jgi:ornithine decarboxylase
MLQNLPKIHVLHDITMIEFMREIAKEKKSRLLTEPFSVTNISTIIDQTENWRRWFGSVEPYYALKAQNNPVTQRLFHRLGLGYDCASLPEIQSVTSTGCDPMKIIVSHPFKSYHCVAGWFPVSIRYFSTFLLFTPQ